MNTRETPQEELELLRVVVGPPVEELIHLGMITESPSGSRMHHFVSRDCEHQQNTPLPCAWPSCPQGHQGKRLSLTVVRKNGERVRVRFIRRFDTATGRFSWGNESPN